MAKCDYFMDPEDKKATALKEGPDRFIAMDEEDHYMVKLDDGKDDYKSDSFPFNIVETNSVA